MATTKSKQAKTKSISALGALLIVCMLLIAGCTIAVNFMFRNGNAPKIGENRYCFYNESDMGDRVPAGSLVIAKPANQLVNHDVVLYRTTSAEYRIAEINLMLGDGEPVSFYLMTVTNPTAIVVSKDDIVGVCTGRSPELGVTVGFLTGTVGIVIGLILPCVVLLLYLIAVLVAAKENADQQAALEDDTDTDLAFVKSIQKKQQEIAARDAKRHAREAAEAGEELPAKKQHRLSDEELASLEEEEAARRAERIAAVRSHMEQRRSSDSTDGVPLYTTEIITKTHTLSIPKVSDRTMTTTQQRAAVKSSATAEIRAQRVRPVTAQIEVPVKPAEKEKPVETPKPAAPVEEVKPAPVPAPIPEPEEDSPITSASFDDLMAFLNSEEDKLI